MFKDLGIKSRVLMLTLLPTCLLALVLGGYFTWVQLSGLQAQLLQRGEMVVEQLAPLAAPALQRGDAALLQRIAKQALEQPDVRAVGFRAGDGRNLAHAGPSMLNAAPVGGELQAARRTGQDATRFLLPVFEQHLSLTGAPPREPASRLLGWVELELSHHNTLLSGYRSLFASLLLIVALSLPRFGGTANLWMNGLYEALCVLVIFPLVVAIGAGQQQMEGVSLRIARFFGDLSYPLYITHYPLVYIYMAWIVTDKPTTNEAILGGVAVAIGAVASAYASLKLYDLPVRRWLGARLLKRAS